jgi:hypothetical protein
MSEPTIESVRKDLAKTINDLKTLESQSKTPIIQELVLARRDAESSRMRTGAAMTYEKGQDPFPVEETK